MVKAFNGNAQDGSFKGFTDLIYGTDPAVFSGKASGVVSPSGVNQTLFKAYVDTFIDLNAIFSGAKHTRTFQNAPKPSRYDGYFEPVSMKKIKDITASYNL